MGVRMLGAVEVDSVALRPREQVVLTALAVRRGHAVNPDQIGDVLWGDDPPASWAKQVQICVARLRRALGAAAITTTPHGYLLDSGTVDVDVDRFEELIGRGRAFVVTGEHHRGIASFARALSMWHGPPFQGVESWPAARIEASRLEELRRSAEEELLDARLAIGEHREVSAAAEALAAEEPLRERRWAILALAQYRCGRQAEALRTLRRLRRTLVEELGIDPSSEVAELETAMLRQEPGLRPPLPQSEPATDCPYKGLAAYDVADSESFFGRESEIVACLERLRGSPLLVVTGASGSGKSSLVRAGIVPALAARGQHAVVRVPGPTPNDLFERPVPAAERARALVIDQFEELLATGISADALRAMFDELAGYARDHAPVIVVVRVDHLGSLAVNPHFIRLVERGLHLVSPLTGDDLRTAIERPATDAGLRLEPGLTDLLLRDCEDEPGALPLLSYSLAETWRRRDGNVLTVEGYHATGGIRGAIARTADRLYDSLDPAHRATLRSVLLRLVTTSTDGSPIKTRVPTRSLCDDPARRHIVSSLIAARLATVEEESVELAHEALARAWPRLRSWLEDDIAGQRIFRHLSAAADGWESLGRPPSELYRGARLDTAIEWRDRERPDLTVVEVEFLGQSLAIAESERSRTREQARVHARQNRRLRAMLTATIVFLAGAMITGSVAVDQARSARDQRNAALDAEGDADAERDRALAAQHNARVEALTSLSSSLRATSRDVAALLAVEAYRRWPDDPRARSALLATFTGSPGLLSRHYVDGAQWLSGALVPRTSAAVIALDGRQLAMVDVASGNLERRFAAQASGVTGRSLVRVSANGRFAAHFTGVACDDSPMAQVDEHACGELSVYDIAAGERILGPLSPPVGPGDVAINDDGSLVAVAGGYDGAATVYRTVDGEPAVTFAGLQRPVEARSVTQTAAVAFGRDGSLYLGSSAGAVRVIEPTSMEVTRSIAVPPLSTNVQLTVLSDETVIGTGEYQLVTINGADGAINWHVDIRDRMSRDPCPWFTVSELANRVYCGNHFGEIEERDLATGQRTGTTFQPQLGDVGDLAISPDGRELVIFGADAPAITRWRLDGSGPVTTHVAEGHVIYDGYDPSGSIILVAARDEGVATASDFDEFVVWDPATDRAVDSLPAARYVQWAGGFLLGEFLDPPVEISFYDTASSRRIDGSAIPQNVCCMFTSAGRQSIYVAFDDGTIWTIDARTRRRIEPTIDAGGPVRSIAATPAGSRVVVVAETPSGTSVSTYDTSGTRIAGPVAGPTVVEVSPRSFLLVASGAQIFEYGIDHLQPMNAVAGARADVNSLQFSADGNVLLATATDQTVSVYDMGSRIRLGDPIPTASPLITPGYLRPDGMAIAVTDRTGVAIWDLDPQHQAEAACQLAGRNLTTTEWVTYLGRLGPYRQTCPEFAAED